MLFDELTPDTSAYMVAGYSIFFLIMLIYVGSLFIRKRNLDRDLITLDNLQRENEAIETAKAAQPKRAPTARKTAKGAPARKKATRKK